MRVAVRLQISGVHGKHGQGSGQGAGLARVVLAVKKAKIRGRLKPSPLLAGGRFRSPIAIAILMGHGGAGVPICSGLSIALPIILPSGSSRGSAAFRRGVPDVAFRRSSRLAVHLIDGVTRSGVLGKARSTTASTISAARSASGQL